MSELSCDTPFIGRNETHDLIRYPVKQIRNTRLKGWKNNAIVILLSLLKAEGPLLFGFHRMSSSCVMGTTASGGVTFMRAFSSLIPSTCFIACLLFAWTLDKLPRFVRHSCFYARK